MDCIITITGYGSSKKKRQGLTAKTKTGPVRDFIKDLESYYRGVYKHCVECDKCDRNEILRGFLANRMVRHEGFTSDLLAKYAFKYSKLPGVDQSLVSELIWRTTFPSTFLLDHAQNLTTRQILQHVELNRSRGTLRVHTPLPYKKKSPSKDDALRVINAAIQIYQAGGHIPQTIDDLDKLVSIALILST